MTHSYRHVFTGAKRPLPDEARGGIIADEMGLGKSLVILSIIAGSLDRAGKFVAEHQTSDSQQQKEISSGATLILVPSSCKYFQSKNTQPKSKVTLC